MQKTLTEQIKGLLEQIKDILDASQQFGGDLDLVDRATQIKKMDQDINRLDYLIGEKNGILQEITKEITKKKQDFVALSTEQDKKTLKEREDLFDALKQLRKDKSTIAEEIGNMKRELNELIRQKEEIVRNIKIENQTLIDLLVSVKTAKQELQLLKACIGQDINQIVDIKVNEKKIKLLVEEIKKLSRQVLDLKTEKRLLIIDVNRERDKLDDLEQSVGRFLRQMNAKEKFLSAKEKRVNSTAKTLQKHLDKLKIPIKL